MKKYIFAIIIVSAIVFCKNDANKKTARYFRDVYDLVRDEYAMYGEQEGKSIAVYDGHNNKIRLINTDGIKGRRKFVCFYKRDNYFVFEIDDNSGIIFTEGNKISVDKYSKLSYLFEDGYYYKKK